MEKFKEFEVKNLKQIVGGNDVEVGVEDPSGELRVRKLLCVGVRGLLDGVRGNTDFYADVLGREF